MNGEPVETKKPSWIKKAVMAPVVVAAFAAGFGLKIVVGGDTPVIEGKSVMLRKTEYRMQLVGRDTVINGDTCIDTANATAKLPDGALKENNFDGDGVLEPGDSVWQECGVYVAKKDTTYRIWRSFTAPDSAGYPHDNKIMYAAKLDIVYGKGGKSMKMSGLGQIPKPVEIDSLGDVEPAGGMVEP